MKNEGLLKAPHSSERLQSYEYFRHIPNVLPFFLSVHKQFRRNKKQVKQLTLFPLHPVHLHVDFALAQKLQLNL